MQQVRGDKGSECQPGKRKQQQLDKLCCFQSKGKLVPEKRHLHPKQKGADQPRQPKEGHSNHPRKMPNLHQNRPHERILPTGLHSPLPQEVRGPDEVALAIPMRHLRDQEGPQEVLDHAEKRVQRQGKTVIGGPILYCPP